MSRATPRLVGEPAAAGSTVRPRAGGGSERPVWRTATSPSEAVRDGQAARSGSLPGRRRLRSWADTAARETVRNETAGYPVGGDVQLPPRVDGRRVRRRPTATRADSCHGRRGAQPRRARLRVSHVNPMSVLRLSLTVRRLHARRAARGGGRAVVRARRGRRVLLDQRGDLDHHRQQPAATTARGSASAGSC